MPEEKIVPLHPDIIVKDYIIPHDNSNPFYIVASFWCIKDKKGIVLVEGLNPLSHFYTPKRVELYEFSDIEKIQKKHEELTLKYNEMRENVK